MILYIVVIALMIILFLLIKFFDDIHRKHPKTIGFFHPYANDGGGGERVLWYAINSLQKKYPDYKCIVYTGDRESSFYILDKVQKNFGINIDAKNIHFVFLKLRPLIESKYYPFFTLLGQSLGSLILGIEARLKYCPTILIDTAGFSYALPTFKYMGSDYIGCYVHYPTISNDMIKKVQHKEIQYNNSAFISKYHIVSVTKLYYYKLFAKLYGIMGRNADFIFVNSSWTNDHILNLWNKQNKTYILYPPCDTKTFSQLNNTSENWVLNDTEINIVSIGQFRPEKDHVKQLKSFKLLLKRIESAKIHQKYTIRLSLVGSARHKEDISRIEKLKELCSSLNITQNVDFKINLNFDDLKLNLSKALIGIHTMWNEHFGIGIVECMAAGLIMIANNSGGPKLDIMKPFKGNPVGFLADTEETYADTMFDIINMSAEERNYIRHNAREAV
ncbi:GDP-Man:Man(3)GlcNAc(2)-PP-Dol alpha-1,2-mannosyltransferase-like isoform X2 [Gordionus sp. m RMFG-2023]